MAVLLKFQCCLEISRLFSFRLKINDFCWLYEVDSRPKNIRQKSLHDSSDKLKWYAIKKYLAPFCSIEPHEVKYCSIVFCLIIMLHIFLVQYSVLLFCYVIKMNWEDREIIWLPQLWAFWPSGVHFFYKQTLTYKIDCMRTWRWV